MRHPPALPFLFAFLMACDPAREHAEAAQEEADEHDVDDEDAHAHPVAPGLELDGQLEQATPPAGCTWEYAQEQYATTGVKTASAYCIGGPVLAGGRCNINHEDHAWLTSSGSIVGIPGNGWQCRAYHSDADWFFTVQAYALCCEP
ncbi:MAG TPA: hypothetical protein VG755_09530 [Nannocystaceae bacterium]|nr:hypothetical protein [Nannocystaceae bacterium]